ncbi:hypothetical protein ACZ90_65485 [Streptomyces albus subsp. albus]|nr:hypothetical protein ACZ90_65485 [Streptomyces albus subsp. albus]
MSDRTALPPSGATLAVRRLAAPLGALGTVLAAFAVVAVVDPNEPGHYPVCPLLRHTGILCPGCGGLRGAHALAHGHPLTALGANALAFTGYLAFAAGWTVWLVRSAAGRPAPALRLTAARGWAAAAVVLLFTVLRNLPAGRSLAP